MTIQILHLIEGAKQAEGLAVIIDVFRAFSLEPYLFAAGAERIRPVGRSSIPQAPEHRALPMPRARPRFSPAAL